MALPIMSLWSVEGNVVAHAQGDCGKIVRLESGQEMLARKDGAQVAGSKLQWMKEQRQVHITPGLYRPVDQAGLPVPGAEEYKPAPDDEFMFVVRDKTLHIGLDGLGGAEVTEFKLRPGEALTREAVAARFLLGSAPWGLRRDESQCELAGMPDFNSVRDGDRLWVVRRPKQITVHGDTRVTLHGISGLTAVIDVQQGWTHQQVLDAIKGPLRSSSARVSFSVYDEANAKRLDSAPSARAPGPGPTPRLPTPGMRPLGGAAAAGQGAAVAAVLDYDAIAHQSVFYQRFHPKTITVRYNSAGGSEKVYQFTLHPGVDTATHRKEISRRFQLSEKDLWTLRTQKGAGGERVTLLWAHVASEATYWMSMFGLKSITVYGDQRDGALQGKVERVEIPSALGARTFDDIAFQFQLDPRQFVLYRHGQRDAVLRKEQLEYHQVSSASEYDLVLKPKRIHIDDLRAGHDARGDAVLMVEPGDLKLHEKIAHKFSLDPDRFELCASADFTERLSLPYGFHSLKHEKCYYIYRRPKVVRVSYAGDSAPDQSQISGGSFGFQTPPAAVLDSYRSCEFTVDSLAQHDDVVRTIYDYFSIACKCTVRNAQSAGYSQARLVWDEVSDGQQFVVCKYDKVITVRGDTRMGGHCFGEQEERLEIRAGLSARHVWGMICERFRLADLCAEFLLGDASEAIDFAEVPRSVTLCSSTLSRPIPKASLSHRALVDGTRLALRLPLKHLTVHAAWLGRHSSEKFAEHEVEPLPAAASHQQMLEEAVHRHKATHVGPGRYKLCGVYATKLDAIEAMERTRAELERDRRWSEREVQQSQLAWENLNLRGPDGECRAWVNLYKWKSMLIARDSARGPNLTVDCPVDISLEQVLRAVAQKWPDWAEQAGGIGKIRLCTFVDPDVPLTTLSWFSVHERLPYLARGGRSAPLSSHTGSPRGGKRGHF
eukprot:TRINITY_DN64922_c0_g1_i1.p1 TRINITY_DN64922_c0_g1~~TRINITY_DN64922_c0_g1_i1.p1  ORF type:complete len:941 (+),score=226.80 TRINITY_DN64922_c0_g1_i1:99-2921(+)